MDIEQHLQHYFGFDSLRSGQKEVISSVLAGQSAAAIFPTGSGKSLCYQLPALMLPHLTLVVSPLLALMKDQIAFLHSRNIPAASIDSTQTREEAQAIMNGVRSGNIKILMISVERLKNERFREFISQVPISLLVVDEAHCISEWGHNFRPDYLKLPQYRDMFHVPQVLLLTATATPKVIDDMSRRFDITHQDIVVTGFYRANLNLKVLPTPEQDKLRVLSSYLQPHRHDAVIIYVTLQKRAEEVAAYLNTQGIQAEAYHAGLKSDVREAIQERFMHSQTPCIVATIAFGMGIDKSDIRHVIHLDLPKSIENYAQEIGRAGRDGESSECLLLADLDGLNVLENFVYGDTPELRGITYVLSEIKKESSQWEVLAYPLSTASNIRQLPLKTLLVYLEMKGIIASKYSYFAEYRYQLLIDENGLIGKFEGERQAFVKALLQNSKRARTWSTLNMDQLLGSYDTNRSRVVTALDYFQQKGWLLVESKQMTDVYAVLDNRFDVDDLARELYERFVQKEHSEIERITAMLELFQSNSCISLQLAHYFGDSRLQQPCGHCSVCLGHYHPWPPRQAHETLSGSVLETMTGPLKSAMMTKLDMEPSNDLLCRYLCGITTPHLTKIKARGLGSFGRLEAYAYADVKKALLEQHEGISPIDS